MSERSLVARVGRDRMNVKIVEINVGKSLSAPYIRLTLGDQVLRTTVSPHPAGLWNEAFDIMVSFHMQLFGILQVDLYESRAFLPDIHIGRAEIKLSLLFDLPQSFKSWYELWHKEHSDSSSIKPAESQHVGGVHLEIAHHFTAQIHSQFFPSSSTTTYPSIDSIASLSPHTSSRPLSPSVPRFLSEAPIATAELVNAEAGISPISNLAECDIENKMKLPRVESDLLSEEDLEFDQKIAESAEYFEKEESEFEAGNSKFIDRLGDIILSRETNDVIKSVRRLLAAFGQGLELSNASMLSGIMSLERFYINHGAKKTKKRVLELGKIDKARHFYTYAMAAYGWKGLNFFGKGKGIISDGTRFDSDRKSVLEFLSLPKDKLLEFEINSGEIFRPGYFIALDDIRDSLVISIRGTMSTIDTLTDLVCDYAPWKDGLVHSGIKSSAEVMFDLLLPSIKKYIETCRISNLVICGHSLGGATASMLTMIILENISLLEVPSDLELEIHCYSYAAAPIATLNIAKRYDNYIDTFVVEDDFVCRLSYGHMMDLKSMIVCAVETEKRDSSLVVELWKNMVGAPRKFGKGNFPALNSLATYRDRIRNADPKIRNIKLYLVGCINFMYYDDPSTRPFSSLMPKYSNLDLKSVSTTSIDMMNSKEADSSLINTESNDKAEKIILSDGKPFKRVIMEISTPEYFDEIIVKRTMLLEHIPNAYDKALKRAFETLMMDLGKQE